MTPEEMQMELSELNIKKDSLHAKIKNAVNSDNKLATRDDYYMVQAHIDLLTYIMKDIAESEEPERGISRMEVSERMWELMEAFGITEGLMFMSETDEEDYETYYEQAIDLLNQVKYLVGLEAYMQGKNYNKDITPGDEDDIMELIEELREERNNEEIDQ